MRLTGTEPSFVLQRDIVGVLQTKIPVVRRLLHLSCNHGICFRHVPDVQAGVVLQVFRGVGCQHLQGAFSLSVYGKSARRNRCRVACQKILAAIVDDEMKVCSTVLPRLQRMGVDLQGFNCAIFFLKQMKPGRIGAHRSGQGKRNFKIGKTIHLLPVCLLAVG